MLAWEEAVPERVDFEVADAVGGITGTGEHVVPLEHLMQHDAVEKAAQAEPEQDAGEIGNLPFLCSVPLILSNVPCGMAAYPPRA